MSVSGVNMSRHLKIRDHAAVGYGNINILRKDIDWSTVKFMETISFNSLNDHFLHDDFRGILAGLVQCVSPGHENIRFIVSIVDLF
jgi:hypothetical protein